MIEPFDVLYWTQFLRKASANTNTHMNERLSRIIRVAPTNASVPSIGAQAAQSSAAPSWRRFCDPFWSDNEFYHSTRDKTTCIKTGAEVRVYESVISLSKPQKHGLLPHKNTNACRILWPLTRGYLIATAPHKRLSLSSLQS